MTSNIGAEQIMKGGGIGFATDTDALDVESFDKVSHRLVEIAKKHFKPEFMNRVDEIIVFRKLNREDLKEIVSTEITKVTDRMKDRNLVLNVTPEVLDFIIKKGYKPEYGARPIRRAVQQYLEDSLAEEILKGIVKEGVALKALLQEEKLVFVPTEPPPEAPPEKPRKSVARNRTARGAADAAGVPPEENA